MQKSKTVSRAIDLGSEDIFFIASINNFAKSGINTKVSRRMFYVARIECKRECATKKSKTPAKTESDTSGFFPP